MNILRITAYLPCFVLYLGSMGCLYGAQAEEDLEKIEKMPKKGETLFFSPKKTALVVSCYVRKEGKELYDDLAQLLSLIHI